MKDQPGKPRKKLKSSSLGCDTADCIRWDRDSLAHGKGKGRREERTNELGTTTEGSGFCMNCLRIPTGLVSVPWAHPITATIHAISMAISMFESNIAIAKYSS